MLSLTLRSGQDGRFLARVVDQGGRPFVLDYGDARVIEDLVQRITRGFTVIRQGRLLHVHPGDEDLMIQLAGFYADEGALVFFEEPGWPGRKGAVAPRVVTAVGPDELDAAPELPEDDDPTESVELADLPSVDEALTTLVPPDAFEPPRLSAPVVPATGPAETPPAADDDPNVGLLPSVPSVDRD